jgi:hypothetical protein
MKYKHYMKTYFSILPQEVLTHIYEFDNTYMEILKNDIAVEIWKETWRRWLRHIVPDEHDNYNRYIIIFENGLRKNPRDIAELELKNIYSNVHFSMTYYLQLLLFSMVDLWGFDYYRRNYRVMYADDCRIHVNYDNNKLVEVKLYIIDFDVSCIWRGCVLTKEQFQKEKMVTSNNPKEYIQNKVYSDDERLLFTF